MSYGFGGGVGVRVSELVVVHLGLRYLYGSEAEYLTDNASLTGSVARTSRTDILLVQLGVGLQL